jgi:hypothetical protein
MSKTISFTILLILISQIGFAQTIQMKNTIGGGIGIGTIIAIIVSWHRNQSILWCIVHGIFGWLYVIYYVLTR